MRTFGKSSSPQTLRDDNASASKTPFQVILSEFGKDGRSALLALLGGGTMPTCYVTAPFGVKSSRDTGQVVDYDHVYQSAVAACERAKKRKEADEWLRPTLLGAAFDAGDADKAEELATEVLAEGAARWKLATTETVQACQSIPVVSPRNPSN
jgi:hypothetical protein